MTDFRSGIQATVPALRRYARALTREADLADELVQDTLLRALRSQHLFQGGDLRAWLYTILTNLNRNRLRTLARRPTHLPMDVEPPDWSSGPTGSRDIARALDTLPEEQRSVLLLVALEGFSYKDVAEIQGVPIGTIMSRLSRARTQVRAFLEGERSYLRRVK